MIACSCAFGGVSSFSSSTADLRRHTDDPPRRRGSPIHVVVMPINAFLLAQHLPNAQLIMYPDASHGAQSQHADVFCS
jgi:pimeloyl-ACP methyl ester carboxylesterase